MMYHLVRVTFFILLALLLAIITISLFDYSEQVDLPEPVKPQRISPYFLAANEIPGAAKTELIFYPQNPAPGDYVIIEAGPLPAMAVQPDVQFDFAGNVSDFYQLGNMVYAVAAIYYETEPDIYNLELIDTSAQSEEIIVTVELAVKEKDFHFSSFSMPPSRTEGWTAQRLAEDREKIRLAREETEQHPLWEDRFIWPMEGRISSEYGAIRVINQNPPRRHAGIDIANDEGEPVQATNSGVVRLAEYLLSGGNTVIIDHGLDISSTYMHLHTIDVEVGEQVDRGEVIGTNGMTGYATGPHLHWEVNIGLTPVNPEQLFDNELLLIPPAYVKEKVESWQ